MEQEQKREVSNECLCLRRLVKGDIVCKCGRQCTFSEYCVTIDRWMERPPVMFGDLFAESSFDV